MSFIIIDYSNIENVYVISDNDSTKLFHTKREAMQYAYRNLSHDDWIIIRIT
jgi:hypothetical protein